jgi:hypothetical protein
MTTELLPALRSAFRLDPETGKLFWIAPPKNHMATRRDKSSGLPRGVTNYRGKFRAQVHINGKRIVIGSFDTPEEASVACAKKREELYGEFA